MTTIKLGLVGAGNRGRGLIRFIDQMKELELAAIADVSDANLAKSLDVCTGRPAVVKSCSELIAMGELDAVLVATPNALHADMAIAALKAGKAVYLEKPAATTIADCDKIIAAADTAGSPLMVGLQLRYSEMILKVKELIDRGEIGAVRMIRCKEYRGPFNPGWNDWRLSAELSGGSLVEKNCHHFDLFNWFAGANPKRVSAFGGSDVVYKGGEIVDNACVITEYENRVRTTLELSLFTRPSQGLEFGVVGENGVIESFFKRGEIVVSTPDRKEKEIYKITPKSTMGHGGTEFPALQAFIEAVRTGKSPQLDARTGKQSVLVSLAAERSIVEGRVVSIAELLQ